MEVLVKNHQPVFYPVYTDFMIREGTLSKQLGKMFISLYFGAVHV